MSATNHTTNYNLPIFVEVDIPTWLGDWNRAMNTIDQSLQNIKENSGSDVDKAYVDGEIKKVNSAISTLNTTVTSISKTLSTIEQNVNNLMQNAVTWGATNTGLTAKQYEQLKIKASK